MIRVGFDLLFDGVFMVGDHYFLWGFMFLGPLYLLIYEHCYDINEIMEFYPLFESISISEGTFIYIFIRRHIQINHTKKNGGIREAIYVPL